jgi:pentose-5-phosphate-3-epimerase
MPAKTVIPTALVYSKKELEDWAKECQKHFSAIHVDVVDASYDTETYFDELETFKVLKDFEKLVVHLMVEDPVLFLQNKANTLKKDGTIYIFKYTHAQDILTIKNLKSLGYTVGICFEIGDSTQVNPEIFSLITEVMFVAVAPGQSGREANLDMLEELNKFYKTHKLDVFDHIKVSVDGGLKANNLRQYVTSNANILYTNSFLKNSGIDVALKKLSNFT